MASTSACQSPSGDPRSADLGSPDGRPEARPVRPRYTTTVSKDLMSDDFLGVQGQPRETVKRTEEEDEEFQDTLDDYGS